MISVNLLKVKKKFMKMKLFIKIYSLFQKNLNIKEVKSILIKWQVDCEIKYFIKKKLKK